MDASFAGIALIKMLIGPASGHFMACAIEISPEFLSGIL
jgi:hypothetical protein